MLTIKYQDIPELCDHEDSEWSEDDSYDELVHGRSEVYRFYEMGEVKWVDPYGNTYYCREPVDIGNPGDYMVPFPFPNNFTSTLDCNEDDWGQLHSHIECLLKHGWTCYPA